MAWPFGGKKRRPAAERAADGSHVSQALGLVLGHLARRPGAAVLDLGPSSNETLAAVGPLAELVICDLFRACAQDGTGGLAYRAAGEVPLPDGEARFDALLVWDLMHYLAPGERAAFGERLGRLARPGAHALLVASWAAPIPPSPVHYRILDRGRLGWHVPEGRRLPAPKQVPRQIEKAMPGFATERVFQLKNGLQEIVLVRAEPPPPDDAALAPPGTAD